VRPVACKKKRRLACVAIQLVAIVNGDVRSDFIKIAQSFDFCKRWMCVRAHKISEGLDTSDMMV
jgi:hypothetical protein